ncbi:MAG: CbiX/SirB N-terminal domain-containing protein [Corynebacterium sp.]|nr:CbiX/SirB N-terminal domain-containing protein [Corynebacterium sp.]
MSAVVLLAHGSRHHKAAEGVEQLVQAVQSHTDKPIIAAHLDFHDQDLAAACRMLRSNGHEKATVVPLLFTQAYHQTIDVPNVVAQEESMELTLVPGLGTGDAIAELLQEQLPEGSYPVIYAVGSSNKKANMSVEKLAARLGGEAIFATNSSRTLGDVIAEGGSERHVHVLPLFVTYGLLLEQLQRRYPPTEQLSYSPPLREKLVHIVKRRSQC